MIKNIRITTSNNHGKYSHRQGDGQITTLKEAYHASRECISQEEGIDNHLFVLSFYHGNYRETWYMMSKKEASHEPLEDLQIINAANSSFSRAAPKDIFWIEKPSLFDTDDMTREYCMYEIHKSAHPQQQHTWDSVTSSTRINRVYSDAEFKEYLNSLENESNNNNNNNNTKM